MSDALGIPPELVRSWPPEHASRRLAEEQACVFDQCIRLYRLDYTAKCTMGGIPCDAAKSKLVFAQPEVPA